MDITRLLEPLGEDTPSGIELRNEAGFHSLERLIEPAARENRLNSDGSINEAAPDVDWDAVFDGALALAAKGRDLRLLCVVVRALYAEQGFAGLRDGLALLTDTLDQYWDSLHPELRERDDPVAAALPRTNALRQLDNDDNGLLGDIKFSVVLNPRGIGPILSDDLAKAALSDFEVLNRAASGLGQAEKDALVARHGQRVNRVKAAPSAGSRRTRTRRGTDHGAARLPEGAGGADRKAGRKGWSRWRAGAGAAGTDRAAGEGARNAGASARRHRQGYRQGCRDRRGRASRCHFNGRICRSDR
ncbi:ImpA family type VI secretion system protein [Sulfitobacter porphyrae]|uniref:ImpA family type VI secretion system protein n=1 Tax=Sulfitobacter porphyrae TaxID=1246864 RepID=A0ABW2BA09_9RHOB